MKYSKAVSCLLAAGSVGLAFLMVRYPETTVAASIAGLKIWWENVFPALFPFFVLSELMIGFGVVTFAGVLLEPVMRPLFRLPGVGGFVFMMGLVSGFPSGARMTTRLYQEKKLSKTEAERLASFTNFSNPLFLFSVTAVQFFHQASLGIIFALAHYLGNIAVGLVMRFIPGEDRTIRQHRSSSLFVKAINRMHEERIGQRIPFGKMLGDAVVSSVRTLLAIGGFIAFFSMVYQLSAKIGLIHLLGGAMTTVCDLFGFSRNLGPASVPGIFELTIGADKIGETAAPLGERVILVSALLGFCGLSIQAQAVGILAQAGLSVRPFLIGRLIQAVTSGAVAWLLYRLLNPVDHRIGGSITAFGSVPEAASSVLVHSGSLITFTVLSIFIILLIRRCAERHL